MDALDADPIARMARIALGAFTAPKSAAPRAMDLRAFRTRYANDFLSFVSLLEVLPKEADSDGPVPFVLTPIQAKFNAERSPRDIALKPRQVGLTTLEQARDIWYWLTRSGAAVRILVQSSTDHGPKNDRAKNIGIMLAALKKHGLKLTLEAEAVGRWLLSSADGGGVLEIIEAGASAAAASKKGRGGTTHRLHVTELSFFEYAGATLKGIRQTVPKPESGSEMTIESTANGCGAEGGTESRDESGGAVFYRMWIQAEQGRNGFKPHFFRWFETPEYQTPLDDGEEIEPATEREEQLVALGCTPEQIKWYRAQVAENGQDATDQEYPSDPRSCFLASGRPFFDKARTAALLAACEGPAEVITVRRLGADGTLRVWFEPELGQTYVVAVDTSEGSGGDRGCAQVWERGTGLHCGTLAGQFKPAELAREAAALGYRYAAGGVPATVAVERNNHGTACLQELLRSGPDKAAYPNVFHDHDAKPGWLTHEVSRSNALARIEQDHREGTWTTVDVELVGEIRTFIVNKRGRPEGARGAKDDLVMTAVIAWDVLGRQPAQATVGAYIIGDEPPRPRALPIGSPGADVPPALAEFARVALYNAGPFMREGGWVAARSALYQLGGDPMGFADFAATCLSCAEAGVLEVRGEGMGEMEIRAVT